MYDDAWGYCQARGAGVDNAAVESAVIELMFSVEFCPEWQLA